jgi:hypothetical protein
VAGDNLFAILDMIRAEMPEISDDAWARIKQGLSRHAGTGRVYVPAQNRKRAALEQLDALAQDASAQQIAKLLGVSVVHARRLRRLRG